MSYFRLMRGGTLFLAIGRSKVQVLSVEFVPVAFRCKSGVGRASAWLSPLGRIVIWQSHASAARLRANAKILSSKSWLLDQYDDHD